MKLSFKKTHGLGNDIIIFEHTPPSIIMNQVKFLCDRKYGIGADCITLCNPDMVYFWNSDGSEANLCGNACRCIIKYVGMNKFMTKSGLVSGTLDTRGDVSMKYPIKPTIIQEDEGYTINVGNQHRIFFTPVQKDRITQYSNTMFLTKLDNEWFMRSYEAGVGETNACGSGAMASAIAIWHKYNHLQPIRINMKGGSLLMKKENESFFQYGPAEFVFEGAIMHNF